MPLKNGHLTSRERAFVGHMARTGDPVHAAAKAGYSSPANRGPEKARTLGAAVRAEYTELISSELVPLAFDALKRNLTESAIAPGARNQAAKIVLDRAYAPGASDADKDPSDMSADEIAARIRALEALQAAIADKAKDVTPVELDDDPDDGVFG